MPAELVRLAQRAGRRLARRLAEAERDTQGWRDERLTRRLATAALADCLAELGASGCWGQANRLASGQVWRAAERWLARGELQRRAREKPRGYAGDFELLDRICRRWIGDDPLGRVFDAFFQNQAAPEAVRWRTQLTARQIAAERSRRPGTAAFHVLSYGAGPAADVLGALESLPAPQRRGMSVTLLDLDPQALEFARGRLLRYLSPEAVAVERANLLRLARSPASATGLPLADFVVCPGLLDYLAPPDGAALLQLLWRRLRPGGRLLAFNFAPANPSRAYMEWIGNWYLTHRSANELSDLAAAAGLPPGAWRAAADSAGVAVLLDARRGGASGRGT